MHSQKTALTKVQLGFRTSVLIFSEKEIKIIVGSNLINMSGPMIFAVILISMNNYAFSIPFIILSIELLFHKNVIKVDGSNLTKKTLYFGILPLRKLKIDLRYDSYFEIYEAISFVETQQIFYGFAINHLGDSKQLTELPNKDSMTTLKNILDQLNVKCVLKN